LRKTKPKREVVISTCHSFMASFMLESKCFSLPLASYQEGQATLNIFKNIWSNYGDL